MRLIDADALVEALNKNTLLCVVCDGMGGANGGNIASAMAVKSISERERLT